MTIHGESTEDVSLNLSGSVSETSIENVPVKPGEQYRVVFTGGSSTGDYWLDYTVPEGYYLLINNVARTRTFLDNVSGGYSREYDLELRKRANAGGAPFSEFGGIKVGKSITWEVGLGTKVNGQSANIITFKEYDLSTSSNPIDASMLMWAPPPHYGELRVEYDPGDPDFVRQISVPSGTVFIEDGTGSNNYWLNFYLKDDIEGNPGGLDFPKPGRTPWKTIHVEQPASDQLRVTVTEGSVSEVSFLKLTSGSLSSGNYTWQLQEGGIVSGGGTSYLRTSTYVSSTTSNGRELVITVHDGANTSATVSSVTKQVYENLAWGESLVETIQDPNGAALSTLLEYHTDSSDHGNYRRIKSVTQPTGSWQAMWYYDDWDRRGQLQYSYAPFKSSPATAPSLANQSAADTAVNAGKTVSFEYEESWTTAYDRIDERIEKTNGTMTAKSTFSHTDILGNGHDWNKVRVSEYQHSDGTNKVKQSTLRYRGDAGNDDPGRVLYRENGQITRTVYSLHAGNYTLGSSSDTFDTTTWSGYLRHLTLNGLFTSTSTSSSVSSWQNQGFESVNMEPNRSTMEVVITDSGHAVRSETWVYTGGSNFELLSWTDHTRDEYWRVTKIEDDKGSVEDFIFSGGRLTTKFGADGTETGYTYDLLGRLYQTTLDGVDPRPSFILAGGYGEDWPGQSDVVTTYTNNGINKVTSTVVTSGSLSRTTSATYDLAGRPLTQSEPAPHGGTMTTTYAYANGGRTTTVTAPGGATKTTTAYLDGSAESVSGSAVVRQDFDYAITTGGNRVVKTKTGNNASSEFETEYDWRGSKIAERRPGWNNIGTHTSTWSYNNHGQLIESTSTGSPDTLYFYDDLGYQYRTVLDMDGDGVVDFSGPDRITETSKTFSDSAMPAAGWAIVETVDSYLTDGSSTKTQLGKTVTRVSDFSNVGTGAVSWQRSYDIFGNETTSFTQNFPSTHATLTTTNTPDSGKNARMATYFGREVENVDDTHFRINYDYDDLGRRTRQSHPRLGIGMTDSYGNNQTTYYGSTNYVATVTDHSGLNTTTHTYDSAGRIATTTNDEGGIIRYAYNDRGQVTHTWGDATYPTENVYDDTWGKRTILKTFRGDDANPINWNTSAWPGGSATADLTVWEYDAYTGLLDHKYDSKNVTTTGVPIAGAKSIAYEYTLAGQIAKRTWARGVVTDYTYDPISGELTGVDYSDGTPDIVNIYNRQGLLESVTQGTNTTTYDYCECGKITAEHLGALQGHAHLHYHLDTTGTGTKGRTIGYTLTDNAGTPNTLHEVDYTYDTLGRFDTLTTGGPMGTHVVDYSYHDDAPRLPTGYTINDSQTDHFSYTRTWDNHRNLVSGATTSWGATPTVIADYDYTYDDMHRRMTAVQSGTAFADYGPPTHRRYAYNARSELTGDYGYANGNNTAVNPTDPMGDRAFEFTYDDIGNRITSNRTGNPGLAESYTRNELNQYVSRSHDTLTTSGTVANSSTLVAARIKDDSSGAGGPWVNTDRVANYWSTSLVPRNASQATRDTVDVVAVDPGAGSGGSHRVDDDDTRDAVLPPTGVVRTYDEDGNPLSDGLYTYEWDAENRLVAMETAATTIWSGVERRRYEHTYDHLHRRIRSVTQELNGVWTQLRSHTFIYDGWNVIREYVNDTDQSIAYARTYAWGLDIMGSLSGSGGVQGLAVMHDSHTSTVYLPGYDANGNVAVLVNEDDGSIEAAYEYGPFGELLRQEGDYAEANPFRFSTKYWDEETDLVYYGRRYYDPKDGRFVGRDPIEEQGGINLYAFVMNGPTNRWDYAGMLPGQYETEDETITMDAFEVFTDGLSLFEEMMADIGDTLINSIGDQIMDNIGDTVFIGGGGGASTVAESRRCNSSGASGESDEELFLKPSTAEVCIRCHGVDAAGFHGDVNDHRGLTTIPGVTPAVMEFYDAFANGIRDHGLDSVVTAQLVGLGVVSGGILANGITRLGAGTLTSTSTQVGPAVFHGAGGTGTVGIVSTSFSFEQGLAVTGALARTAYSYRGAIAVEQSIEFGASWFGDEHDVPMLPTPGSAAGFILGQYVTPDDVLDALEARADKKRKDQTVDCRE